MPKKNDFKLDVVSVRLVKDGAVALRISAQLLFLQTETASTRKLLAVGVKYKYATT